MDKDTKALLGITIVIIVGVILIVGVVFMFNKSDTSSSNNANTSQQSKNPGSGGDTLTSPNSGIGNPQGGPQMMPLEGGPTKSGLRAMVKRDMESGRISKEYGETLLKQLEEDTNLPE